jgi:large subunit ribosomal protein L13
MKTVVVPTTSIKREWFIVDAADKVVGRLASKIAGILMGKGKPAFSPNQDHGDYVVIINADKVKLTGKKPELKTYFSHTMYPGGQKHRPFKEQMAKDSTKVITHAIHGMVPKTKLGRAIMRKLHVYTGTEHPHVAQQPKTLSV